MRILIGTHDFGQQNFFTEGGPIKMDLSFIHKETTIKNAETTVTEKETKFQMKSSSKKGFWSKISESIVNKIKSFFD